MKKYLTSYQALENDEWRYYIAEVNLTELICLLEKVVDNSIILLTVAAKPLPQATAVSKDTAKALIAIFKQETKSTRFKKLLTVLQQRVIKFNNNLVWLLLVDKKEKNGKILN